MGNNYDPVTLHKYLYANADPGNLIDPSGQFGLASLGSTLNILGNVMLRASTAYNAITRTVIYTATIGGRLIPKVGPKIIKRCIKKKNKCGLRLNLLIVGNDNPDMLDHIRDAQMSRPRTIMLTYAPKKNRKSGWYNGKGGCALVKPGPSYQCDEYPMQRTREGGPENWPTRVSLRWVSGRQNLSVGGHFGVLAKAMRRSKDYRFFVITSHDLPTMALPLAKGKK